MSIFKKCKCILLPKDPKITYLKVHGLFANYFVNSTTLMLSTEIDKDYPRLSNEQQYLYIVSDDKIMVNDWIINGNVFQSNHVIHFINDQKMANGFNMIAAIMNSNNATKDFVMTKKIIATINPYLTVNNFNDEHIPKIPDSFIQKYCGQYVNGTVITDVTVEYETTDQLDPFEYEYPNDWLKVNLDNTIAIRKVRKK